MKANFEREARHCIAKRQEMLSKMKSDSGPGSLIRDRYNLHDLKNTRIIAERAQDLISTTGLVF